MDNTSQTPPDLSQSLMELAEEYSRLSGDLVEILKVKNSRWKDLRLTTTSDTQATRSWEATPEGTNELVLNVKMKAISKRISATQTRLKVLSDMARNMY